MDPKTEKLSIVIFHSYKKFQKGGLNLNVYYRYKKTNIFVWNFAQKIVILSY